MRSSDRGPWIWTGATSISAMSTSICQPTLRPLSQNMRSESDRLNQNSSWPTRSSTGSLRIPPSSVQRMT